MTTPDERLRALAWGRELLEMFVYDGQTPLESRRTAEIVLRTFPSTGDLLSLFGVDGTHGKLPIAWAESIEAAGRLFRALEHSEDAGSVATRRQLLYTLRHFPLPGNATLVSKVNISPVMGPWLARAPVRVSLG